MKKVEVVGAGLPVATIVAQAHVEGSNIFRLRSDGVVSRLSSVRQIIVTSVHTTLPDTVTIEAQLRPSLAAWQTPQGLFLLDTDGRIMDQISHTTLPIITGKGAHGDLGPGTVQAVRYAVRVLPTAPYGAIAGFHYTAPQGLTVNGRAGWQAIVGTGTANALLTRIADLVGVLRAAWKHKESLMSVDLRYPNPVARLAPR